MDIFGYCQDIIVGYYWRYFPLILNLVKEDITRYTLDNFGRYEYEHLAWTYTFTTALYKGSETGELTVAHPFHFPYKGRS